MQRVGQQNSSLDLISSPSPSLKIQIMGRKVCLKCKDKTLLGDVNKLFVFKALLTTPSNVLPLHLKQIFPPMIWIFTEGEGDRIESRLPFKIFSTLLHWGLPLKYYNLRWNYFLSGGIWNVLEKDISISSQIARELCHSSLSGAFETSTFSKFVISHFKGWPFMSIIISFHSMFYYVLGNAYSGLTLILNSQKF